MRYTLKDCLEFYDFFNQDFFYEELGKKLKKCQLTVKVTEARKMFTNLQNTDYREIHGLSWTNGSINKIWINPLLLNNKKFLMNTLLHEMIHLYVDNEQPNIRSYNKGHGALWKRTAALATKLYGDDLGPIEQYASTEEVKMANHYDTLNRTKPLTNAFIVKINNDLVPVKELTDEQIEELKDAGVDGIFKIKEGIKLPFNTRVTKFIPYAKVLEAVNEGSIDAEMDEICSFLAGRIKLGIDTDRIYLKRK